MKTESIHIVLGDCTEYSQSYVIQENSQQQYTFQSVFGSIEQNITLLFILERNAFLRVELLIAHTSINITIKCILQGQASSAVIHGAYIAHKINKVTIATMQHHTAMYSMSTVVMKGVLYDHAQSHYSGMIRVEKDAHSTRASQENKNIVLSDNARALSIPQIEVLTNEVHCFHGSAVGKCDPEHLFYATSRGLTEQEAETLLLKGFLSDIFENDTMQALLEKVV